MVPFNYFSRDVWAILFFRFCSFSSYLPAPAAGAGPIYAFAQPFQIFILYLITNKDRMADREALERITSFFEYLGVR